MDFDAVNARHDHPDTSFEADAIVSGDVRRASCRRFLELVSAAGEHGMTDTECHIALELLGHHGRMYDLFKKHFVYRRGDKRAAAPGKLARAYVWRATTRGTNWLTTP
jgi:hypothetical protein